MPLNRLTLSKIDHYNFVLCGLYCFLLNVILLNVVLPYVVAPLERHNFQIYDCHKLSVWLSWYVTGKPNRRGKALYSSPRCTNYFISADFHVEICYIFFYSTRYLNEEVNWTEPSPSGSLPCMYQQLRLVFKIFSAPFEIKELKLDRLSL